MSGFLPSFIDEIDFYFYFTLIFKLLLLPFELRL